MINLFFGSDTGYRKGVVNKLLETNKIDFCITDYVPEYDDEKDKRVQNEKIITVHPGTGIRVRYDEIIDINSLPALDKQLMQDMQPYESMAIKFGIRRTNFPIGMYEEEKKNYYLHLRYWNYIMDKYQITHVFFENVPHTQHKWVIYSLAKVKGIPILMLSWSDIVGIAAYGTDIDKLGNAYRLQYRNLPDQDFGSYQFEHSLIKDYYKKKLSDIKKTDLEIAQTDKKRMKSHEKWSREMLWGEYLGRKGFMKYQKMSCRVFLAAVLKYKNFAHYLNLREDLLKVKKWNYILGYYKKHILEYRKEYNKDSDHVDWNEKYILFLLQQTPEETTLPRAGVFAEQYNSIQLIARAAQKEGVYVYVKEHFVQYARERAFYEDLRKIPNVRFIHMNVNTMYAMENSLAVATQTGTCLLEGALMGKPLIVTGEGYLWKGMPGVFEIKDEIQGGEIIKNLVCGFRYDRKELEKYIIAIDKVSIFKDYIGRTEETVRDVTGLISDWIEMKLPEMEV